MNDIHRENFESAMDRLERGEIRVAQKIGGRWQVDKSVKELILSGFRLGKSVQMGRFVDKDTFPERQFGVGDGVRFVPGGSSVRRGAYLAPGTIIMPPSYINAGAYIDSGTMIDSHVTVGSCAQIGKNVHIAAAAQIGGVLEPAGAMPNIIEDGVFVGGNCGIYEGTLVREGAVIASGVIITASTPIFDATKGEFLPRNSEGRTEVPEGAVVVSGSRPLSKGAGAGSGVQVYCPVIIKYRDEKTSGSVSIEELLR